MKLGLEWAVLVPLSRPCLEGSRGRLPLPGGKPGLLAN
jgi:hypothetical protein